MYNLLNVNNFVYDSGFKYANIPESFIQNQWKSMSSKLISTNLGEITILFPGEQNISAGPDFLNSIICLPNGEKLKGAIEIHVNGNDWKKHKHHLNPNYNNILLHISLSLHNNTSSALFEGYFNMDQVIPITKSPCIDTKIKINQLKNILYDLAEIRFNLKVDKFKSYNNKEMIFKIFSFLHFNRQLDDIEIITNKYINLKSKKISNERIIINLKNMVHSINWQGGRSPSIFQLNRIPNIVYAIDYLNLLNNINEINLSHFLQFLKNKNSFKLAGQQFNIEIYINVILPFIMSKYNKNLFFHWKKINSPHYGKIDEILKKWNIDVRLNIALTQGIIFLEKSYCSLNLCEDCPLFINS